MRAGHGPVCWRTTIKSATSGDGRPTGAVIPRLNIAEVNMNKIDAQRIILLSAKKYRDNLENNNVLFVFDNNKKIASFEATFFPRNFQHLTGVRPAPNINASFFYKLSLNDRLSPNDFEIVEQGTTEQKLRILLRMMNIQSTAKMIGDFNNMDSFVIPDKIIGTVYACMGFVRDNGYYVPNTIRLDDIRKITYKPQRQIICTLTKKTDEDTYTSFSSFSKRYSQETVLKELKKLHNNVDIELPD